MTMLRLGCSWSSRIHLFFLSVQVNLHLLAFHPHFLILFIYLLSPSPTISFQPLLQVSARHFATVNATYFLDYGSLLGAWRDGGIIPWEYDVDMAVMDEDCGKFLALKDALKKDGLTLYQRGEFVPHKKRSLA